MIPGPKAPENAPNVLIVSSTTPGSAQPDTFGGQVSTPNLTRVQADRASLQPVPRDRGVLADQGGDAHRAQPASRRLRLGRRVPRAVPRVHRRQAEELHRRAAHPRGERVRHRRLRQVAPDTGQRAGRRRPVRPLADRPGDSTTTGVSSAAPRGSTTRSSPRTTRPSACRRAQNGKPVLLPRRPHRQGRRVAARASGRRMPGSLVHVLLDRLRPRAAPRGAKEWADKYKGKFDDGWDSARRPSTRQKQLGIDPEGHGAHRATRPVPRRGTR